MAKIRATYTIDEEVIRWIEKQDSHNSASEFVNSILARTKQLENDDFQEIIELQLQRFQLEKQIESKLQKFEKVLEDGNKKEREKAKELLDKENESNLRIMLRLIFCHKRLVELGLLTKFNSLESDEDLQYLSREIYKINLSQGRSIIDAVGFLDMKRIKERIDMDTLIKREAEIQAKYDLILKEKEEQKLKQEPQSI